MRLVGPSRQVEQALHLAGIRGEGVERDRPGGASRPSFEIFGQKRQHGPAPQCGGAPETARAPFGGAAIGDAGKLHRIERVRHRSERFPAALQDHDLAAMARKAGGQRHPAGPNRSRRRGPPDGPCRWAWRGRATWRQPARSAATLRGLVLETRTTPFGRRANAAARRPRAASASPPAPPSARPDCAPPDSAP